MGNVLQDFDFFENLSKKLDFKGKADNFFIGCNTRGMLRSRITDWLTARSLTGETPQPVHVNLHFWSKASKNTVLLSLPGNIVKLSSFRCLMMKTTIETSFINARGISASVTFKFHKIPNRSSLFQIMTQMIRGNLKSVLPLIHFFQFRKTQVKYEDISVVNARNKRQKNQNTNTLNMLCYQAVLNKLLSKAFLPNSRFRDDLKFVLKSKIN